MKKLKKGSFTLEAALLMPLLLTVIMSMLYLDFFVHNRAWLTAAAYEAAVSGSMEGYKKEANIYETADIQGRFLGQKWNITVSGTAKPLRPVGWIRRIKGAADALKEVKN